MLQVVGLKQDLQASHTKVEQQERELGGAHQKVQMLEEELARLQQEHAALSLQKAEVDRLQGMHSEHAHIFRQASLTAYNSQRVPCSVHTGSPDTPSSPCVPLRWSCRLKCFTLVPVSPCMSRVCRQRRQRTYRRLVPAKGTKVGCGLSRDQSAAQAQQIMGLSEQLRLAQQDCSVAHQHLHEKDGELLKMQSQHSELQQASRALQAELAAARDRLAVLEADLPMLQQDVLQLSSENTTLHIELEECQAAVQQLREQLGAARQEAQQGGQDSKRQIRSLAAEKDELEHRAKALSVQLSTVQQDFHALSARVQQQDEENDQLQVGPGLTLSLQHPTDPLTLRCLVAF